MSGVDIHGKKLIAVAGYDFFGRRFISVVNKEIARWNLMTIGININDKDFEFFISNLPRSKVEATIFGQEFQERVAKRFGLEGVALAMVSRQTPEFLTAKEPIKIDDSQLMQIIQILRERYGV